MLRRRRLFWSGLDLLDMVDQWLRASNPKLTLCDALTLLLHSRSNSSGWTSVHWTLSYCLHIAFIWCVAFGGMAYHGIIWFIYGLAQYCLAHLSVMAYLGTLWWFGVLGLCLVLRRSQVGDLVRELTRTNFLVPTDWHLCDLFVWFICFP